MSYAEIIKALPNGVKTMLGYVGRKKVRRAIELGREDARVERATNYHTDIEGFASLGKRLAEEASRPAGANVIAERPCALMPRS